MMLLLSNVWWLTILHYPALFKQNHIIIINFVLTLPAGRDLTSLDGHLEAGGIFYRGYFEVKMVDLDLP